MYNVLIVDDEEPVLDSYEHMLSRREDMVLCGKARTGLEALSVVQSTHPDLVLMDIGMPGIDGLKTIEELQKQYPEVLYVVSTAYERFDIAKRAIPLGLFRYLVKPVSKRTFFLMLDDAKNELDMRRRKVVSHMDDLKKAADIHAWEQKNFLSLISWKTLDEGEWQQYRELFHLNGDSAMVCMVSTSGYDEVSGIYEMLVNQLRYKYQILSSESLGKLMILIFDGDSATRIEHAVTQAARAAFPEGLHYTLGFGSMQRYDRLLDSFQEALSSIDAEVFDAGELKEEGLLLKELRSSVARLDDLSQIQERFEKVSDLYLLRGPFDIAKGKLIRVFTLLFDDMESVLPGPGTRQVPFDFIREIWQLADRNEWMLWSERMLSFILERSKLYRMEHRPLPLRRAIAYLDEYYRKPLQLTEVADSCGVSPSYLSRLFSDHMKSSFIDYLTGVRIQQAKQLMKAGGHSIKEISYDVGYQDPNYFSKIFRKFCGISPTQYQKNKGETDD